MAASDPGETFVIEEEKLAYKRYVKMYQREVRNPNGTTTSWDVAGTSNCEPSRRPSDLLPLNLDSVVIALPYHSEDNTITMIREYGQGPNEMVWALAGGMYEPKKTPRLEDAARAELSEEARLTGGKWVSLLPEGDPGIVELKWVANRFWPFLVIDPQVDENPGEREVEEEYITIKRMKLSEVKRLMLAGRLMLASVQSIIMAVDYLKKAGYKLEGWD